MAGWKPGQSGNPQGKASAGSVREKKFLAALERAIAQDDKDRIRKGIEKVLDFYAEGEQWAVEFVAERLDGKPTQQLDMRVERPIRELSDDELADIATSGSAGTADAPSGEKETPQLH